MCIELNGYIEKLLKFPVGPLHPRSLRGHISVSEMDT